MRFLMRACLFSAIVASAVGAQAGTIVNVDLQPADDAAKDTWVYQGQDVFNFDTASLPPSGPFSTYGKILGTANTGASPHNVFSLVQFDLSSLASLGVVRGQQIISATLKLTTVDGSTLGFPFANPSAANPVATQAFQVTQAWTETGATWLDQPTASSTATATANVSGVGQQISLDITALVAAWLDDPSSNFGVQLKQQAEVRNSAGTAIAAVFASSNAASSSARPMLSIVAVPEPGSIALVVAGVVSLLGSRVIRRRRSA